jgi:hypothetical protein
VKVVAMRVKAFAGASKSIAACEFGG